MVLGFDDVSGYEEGGDSIGATVGRKRQPDRRASVVIDGVTYELDKNDNGNNLHSGFSYYNKRIWEVTDSGRRPCHILLHSPDGGPGYPGASGYACDLQPG